jgi:hypothetical protein
MPSAVGKERHGTREPARDNLDGHGQDSDIEHHRGFTLGVLFRRLEHVFVLQFGMGAVHKRKIGQGKGNRLDGILKKTGEPVQERPRAR